MNFLRSAHDNGVITLLDSRMLTLPYLNLPRSRVIKQRILVTLHQPSHHQGPHGRLAGRSTPYTAVPLH